MHDKGLGAWVDRRFKKSKSCCTRQEHAPGQISFKIFLS